MGELVIEKAATIQFQMKHNCVNFWIWPTPRQGVALGWKGYGPYIASSNTMRTDLVMEAFHATSGPCFQPKSDMSILIGEVCPARST